MRRCTLVGIALILVTGVATAQDDRGKRLYDAHCARCHGIGGTGGEGPALARPVLPRAADDETLFDVIRNGIEGTDMPETWQLSKPETEEIVRYVRSLGRIEQEPLTGDPGRGRALYEGRGGCVVCHIVEGEGGILGPDLTNIGSLRGTAHLREALTDPGASVLKGYVVVRAIQADGTEVAGHRINEDSFTIQLRDERGRFHSLSKRDLRELEPKPGQSLMPSYEKELTSDDIEDIVAFLAGLRGAP
ncbi:MAG TPA: c-type cytochrome [Vicinamibacteria bacterium]|nr:c-type cytochrome [Vicinamibacteria bacterium]